MVPAGGWHKFLEKAQEIRSTDQVGTLTRMSLVGRTGIANESQYPQLMNPSLLNKITPAVQHTYHCITVVYRKHDVDLSQ